MVWVGGAEDVALLAEVEALLIHVYIQPECDIMSRLDDIKVDVEIEKTLVDAEI